MAMRAECFDQSRPLNRQTCRDCPHFGKDKLASGPLICRAPASPMRSHA